MAQEKEKGAKTPGSRRRGRPPGQISTGHRMRERARALASADVKPLDVLMQTMAHKWKAAQEAKTPAQRARLELQACAVAEKVAPYLHPKLQATTIKGEPGKPVGIKLELASADALRAAIRGGNKT